MIHKLMFEEDIEKIRFNYLGTGKLYKETKFTWYLLENTQEWRRPGEIVNNPLFIDGIPDRFDALQRTVIDCWLVSAMEAITMNEDLIRRVVPPDQSFDRDYVGAFHFRIWKLGTWYDVVVDDFLPVSKDTGKLCYVHSMKGNVFWAALLEKACAKFFFCEINKPQYGCSYSSINSMESAMFGLHIFSGGIIDKVETSNLPSGMTVKWLINKVYSNHGLMICGCYDYVDRSKGLISNHAYTVTSVVKFEDNDLHYHGLFLVRLMNPLGTTEWNGPWSDEDYVIWKQIDHEIREKLEVVSREDGEFWIGEDHFAKYFQNIWICHLDPGAYLESHKSLYKINWSIAEYPGEWKRDINAGGISLVNRHKNPQYGILFEKRPNVQTRFNVIIELSHLSKVRRDVFIEIGFFVYRLKNDIHPLDFVFFQTHNPLNTFPKYGVTEGRAYSLPMNLDPGMYCIVPCTINANEESHYLLRVWSEHRLIKLWMENKIGKALPAEEETPNECDEGIKTLFTDIAKGEDEIDWTGVKEILEAEMNPKKSYFGIISSVFKTIGEFFEIFLPFRMSNDYETSAVVFSKDECRSMIAMLDDNHSGKLSFSEFSNLWSKICFWTKVYEKHRDETKGYVTVAALRDALSSIGYSVTKSTVISLSYVYANEQGIIYLPDFILCGVTLETVLSLYENENLEDQNKIAFTLEEWVKNTLIL